MGGECFVYLACRHRDYGLGRQNAIKGTYFWEFCNIRLPDTSVIEGNGVRVARPELTLTAKADGFRIVSETDCLVPPHYPPFEEF